MNDDDDWPKTVAIDPIVMGFAIKRELSGPYRIYVRGDVHDTEVARLTKALTTNTTKRKQKL